MKKIEIDDDELIVNATTINDAWHQCLHGILKNGSTYKVTRGSFKDQFRLEILFPPVYIYIKHPDQDMVATIPENSTLPPPTDKADIDEYFSNYLFSDIKKENEQYTYGQRLVNWNGVNQVQNVINMYRNSGFGTNQATMEVGIPSDILLPDPPCLRMIDTRVKDGALHFFVYFRSWDLWGGFPVNLGGLELLKQYMANEIGVKNGRLAASSKGLHLYDPTWTTAVATTKMDWKEFSESVLKRSNNNPELEARLLTMH